MFDLLKKFLRINERALQVSDISARYYEILRDDMSYEYPYIVGNYMDAQGSYLVFTDYGRLYRVRYTTDGYTVEFDEPSEVVIEFSEVSRGARLFRAKNNELRFVAIASAATLNRVGEIDSRELFDSFEENFDEKEPPPLNLYHIQHKAFRMGEVRGLKRDGNLLIVWGTVDERTLLGKYAEKRLSKNDYGMSIEFISTKKEDVNISGVEILSHTRGVFVGVAALKEKDAASYMTSFAIERGNNMDSKLKKILEDFTGDSEAVEKFEDELDIREREIKDNNMVTRANEEEKDNVEEEVETETEVEEMEFEVDADLVEEIAVRAKDIISEEFKSLFDDLKKELLGEMTSLRGRVDEIQKVADVVEEIQETETPLARRTKVKLQRPSRTNNVEKEDTEVDESDLTPSEIAKIRNERFARARTEYSKTNQEVTKKI